MKNWPNKWIALALGLVGAYFGLLYVGRLVWAGIYFVATLGIGISGMTWFVRSQIVPAVATVVLAITCAVHAYQVAKRMPAGAARPRYSRWYGLLAVAAGGAIFVVFIRAFFVEPFRVPSASMDPGIEPGSYLVVTKWGYGHYGAYGFMLSQRPISEALHRGDVVVFDYPMDQEISYVKRVVGLPGDKIVYRNKRLTINGTEIPVRQAGFYMDPKAHMLRPQFDETLDGNEYKTIFDDDAPPGAGNPLPFKFSEKCIYDAQGMSCDIPPDNYFVLGDNRDSSSDSRRFGFVPASLIVGKVWVVLN